MFPVIAHSDDSQIVLTSRRFDRHSNFGDDAILSSTLQEAPDPIDALLHLSRKGNSRLKPIASGEKLRKRLSKFLPPIQIYKLLGQ